jgi:hypothetical protein
MVLCNIVNIMQTFDNSYFGLIWGYYGVPVLLLLSKTFFFRQIQGSSFT